MLVGFQIHSNIYPFLIAVIASNRQVIKLKAVELFINMLNKIENFRFVFLFDRCWESKKYEKNIRQTKWSSCLNARILMYDNIESNRWIPAQMGNDSVPMVTDIDETLPICLVFEKKRPVFFFGAKISLGSEIPLLKFPRKWAKMAVWLKFK